MWGEKKDKSGGKRGRHPKKRLGKVQATSFPVYSLLFKKRTVGGVQKNRTILTRADQGRKGKPVARAERNWP